LVVLGKILQAQRQRKRWIPIGALYFFFHGSNQGR
jgi:hypothetical protein